MKQALKILLLEDSKPDAEIIQRQLLKEKMFFECRLVTDKKEFLLALEEFSPDIIVSDNSLPGFNATEALQLTRERYPHLPFILVTGTVSEEFAANIIKQGADDYILKDRLARLPSSITAALRQRQTEKEKQDAAGKLQNSEEKYRSIMERVSDGFVAISKDWCFTHVNKQAGKILNRLPCELIGKHVWSEFPGGIDKTFYKAFNKAMETQEYLHLEEYSAQLEIWLENHIYPSADGMSIFFRNITERKKAETELRTAHDRLSFHIENAPLGFIEWNNKLLVKSWSRQAEAIFGWTEKEFIKLQKDGYSQVYEEDLPIANQIAVKLLSGKVESISVQHRNYTKDGRVIWCEWFNSVLKDKNENVVTVLSLVQDITERKKSEEALRHGETRLLEAQAIAHISNWEIDLVQQVHTWSDEFYRIFGLEKASVQPSAELFLSLMHPDDAVFAQNKIQEAFVSFKDSSFNFRFVYKNGMTKHGYTEWRFEFDKKGMPLRLFGIMQDITAAKQAEEELKLMEQEMLDQKVQEQKKITRAIIKAQEKERNHIGQELHDNVNQILASTKLFLSIAGHGNETMKDLIKYPMELIDNTIREIRLLSSKQVTPLQNVDLKELVQSQLDNLVGNTSIQTGFVYKMRNKRITDDLKLNIYRIIQEQINNIVKYAGAKKLSISIQAGKKTIDIEVSDDGKGFDTGKKRKGIGISNMINRIESFNGEIALESSPGNGCKIQIAIPY